MRLFHVLCCNECSVIGEQHFDCMQAANTLNYSQSDATGDSLVLQAAVNWCLVEHSTAYPVQSAQLVTVDADEHKSVVNCSTATGAVVQCR